MFSQSRLWDSCSAYSTAAEGVRRGGIGAALVQAVSALVHGGEERAEVIGL